jgi:hypothetical protein
MIYPNQIVVLQLRTELKYRFTLFRTKSNLEDFFTL